MSEPKYSTSAKIMKIFAYLLMGAGMILTMLGISSFIYPGGIAFMDPLYMLLVGIMLLFAGVPLLAIAQQGIIKPEFDTISLVRCTGAPDCKYTKPKKFERGDFVYKELDEKCEKCNSPLHIAAIFDVEKKPAAEKKESTVKLEEEPKEEAKPSKPKDAKTQ